MLHDLWTAWRQLRRKPGIALVAALSLALGTGATAAIFGCLDGFYLRPLPAPKSHQLVRLFAATDQEAYGGISYPEYRAIRAQSSALAALAVAQRRGANLLVSDEPQEVLIYQVSSDFFQVMGIRPALGRFFGPGEEQAPVVVLGYAFWQRQFGGDPTIVGSTIRISRGTPKNATVVGVLPQDFRDLGPTGDRDVWMPPATFVALQGGNAKEFEDWHHTGFEAIGRIRSTATLGQLQSELSTIRVRFAQAHSDTNSRRRFTSMSDLDWRLHTAGTTAWVLLALVILVVAISCVNVANLLLARVEGRRKELATRAALGAGRSRLARQLLAESLLIGLAGTAAGLLLAQWLIAALPALIGMPPEFRSEVILRLDLRVFCSTAAVALGTALLFGLAPAVTGSRADLALALRNAPTAGVRRFPLRTWLAISQLAFSLVLLTVAAVCGQSFWNARHGNIGLARKNILVVWGGPQNTVRAALDRLLGTPGVRDAGVAFRAPLSPSGSGIAMSVTLPGHPEFQAGQSPVVIKFNTVDSRYFHLLGIRLLKGRIFDDGDTPRASPVAVISESMARRYWQAQEPVGKYLHAMPAGLDYRIVGVVADAPIKEIGETPEPYIYTCWWQNPIGENTLLVETDRDAAAAGPNIRALLTTLDARFKHVSLFTMDELIRDSTIIYRAAAQLVLALACLGLLLAAIGFYGVIAYGVTLRTREIGIRMAVGAGRTDAVSLVIRQALACAAIGVGAGLPCSMAAIHALRGMLFGIPAWYTPAFLGGSLIMLVVALVAAVVPAVRAARVQPITALRCE